MLLAATVIPLTSLPTAHPAPEAAQRPVVTRPAPSAGGRFTKVAARLTATAVAGRRR
jgi:hypothetical protein